MRRAEPNWWEWTPGVEEGSVGRVWTMDDLQGVSGSNSASLGVTTDAWPRRLKVAGVEPGPELSFHVMGALWTSGEAFPSQSTPCGWWLADRAVPLVDPLPCTYTDGTSEVDQLGYYLATGTNQTTKLPTGVYRMYFGAAYLAQVATDASMVEYAWPTNDPGGRAKFAIDSDGALPRPNGKKQREFWGASGDDYPNLHFSKEFIGYLDSTDGITFPMYAPSVAPTDGLTCEDASYAGATGTLEDSSSGFWAGWHSTSIRTTGDTVVYRDASVVYLTALGRYVMFVVECDGRGLSTDGLGTDVEDEAGCSLCVPNGGPDPAYWCLFNDQPKTRYVFFTCVDPDFGANAMGPFAVAATPPDYAAGEWLGVPQAFLSPDAQYLLYYLPGPYSYCGMHIARISDLVAEVVWLERTKSAGVDVDGAGILFDQHFVNLGPVVIDCDTPSSGTVPTVTDEHFVFCEDGRLHLYFTNRDTSDITAPLRLVSHAAAFAAWDATAMEALFVTVPVAAPAGEPIVRPGVVAPAGESIVLDGVFAPAGKTIVLPGGSDVVFHGVSDGVDGRTVPPCYFQWLLGLPCVDTSYLSNIDIVAPDPVSVDDILINFRMAACDPVYMSELLGGQEIEDVYGDAVTVDLNDPNVYLAATGEYVMIVQCTALGGLVRLTADVATACASRESC